MIGALQMQILLSAVTLGNHGFITLQQHDQHNETTWMRHETCGVMIHIPCNSIQFWLLPFDFNYYNSIMQNPNFYLILITWYTMLTTYNRIPLIWRYTVQTWGNLITLKQLL